MLSRETHTEMGFFLKLTIVGMNLWIKEYNSMVKEEQGQA